MIISITYKLYTKPDLIWVRIRQKWNTTITEIQLKIHPDEIIYKVLVNKNYKLAIMNLQNPTYYISEICKLIISGSDKVIKE